MTIRPARLVERLGAAPPHRRIDIGYAGWIGAVGSAGIVWAGASTWWLAGAVIIFTTSLLVMAATRPLDAFLTLCRDRNR